MSLNREVPVRLVDIAARRHQEETFRLAAAAVEHSFDGLMILDARGRVLSVNPAFTRITAYSSGQAVGKALRGMLDRPDGAHDEGFFRNVARSAIELGHWEGELKCRSRGRDDFPIWLRLIAIRDADNVPAHYVVVIRDLSQEKAFEQNLEQLALYDSLTGLATRTLLIERGNQAMLKAERHGTSVAVLCVRLDQLEDVNDTYGREVGNELLKLLGAQLGGSVRAYDTVARQVEYGFAILLSEVKGIDDAHIVARKIIKEFAQPFYVSGHNLKVDASVGVACFPEHGFDMLALLDAAEEDLSNAKRSGEIPHAVHARTE